MKKSFSTLLFTLVVLAVQAKEIKPQDETIADTYWRNTTQSVRHFVSWEQVRKKKQVYIWLSQKKSLPFLRPSEQASPSSPSGTRWWVINLAGGSSSGVLSCVPLVASEQARADANYSRTTNWERSLIRTRLCRLPEQEPSKFSISRTASIQRNPANLSKVTKKRGSLLEKTWRLFGFLLTSSYLCSKK